MVVYNAGYATNKKPKEIRSMGELHEGAGQFPFLQRSHDPVIAPILADPSKLCLKHGKHFRIRLHSVVL